MNEHAIDQLVVEKKFPTLEAAQKEAGGEVGAVGGHSMSVVAFRQGQRTSLTGALTLDMLRDLLEVRAAKKDDKLSDARNALNRPRLPEHVRTIADYLKANHEGRYILPPLTLNIQQRVNLYTTDYQSTVKPGFLVVPKGAHMGLTDGQHRVEAADITYKELPEEVRDVFGKDGIAVMITCETETAQIHQDFADCSRTKPLPPSLLAVFDLRNPANRLLADIEQNCALFKGRIDPTSKTLSKRSKYLFLANQARQLIKELLLGSYGVADVAFEKGANERLASEGGYAMYLARYTDYINYVTSVIPVWTEIAALPVDGLEANQIPVKRAQGWVCMTATGLNLIGRIGHELLVSGEKDWQSYAAKLGDIDWRKDAPFWADTIVQNGKILTAQAPLKKVYQRVSVAIGRSPAPAASGVADIETVPQAVRSTV